MDLAVGGVVGQGPIGPFAVGDALQHVRRRMQRVDLQRGQVLRLGDRKRLVQRFPGGIDGTHLEAHPGRDQVCLDVPPVTLQNLFHDGPGTVLEAAQGDCRDTEPGRRVVLVQVQRLREQPGGLVRLVGRQEQPSPALPDAKGLRIELQGRAEEGVGRLKVAQPPSRFSADGAVEALRGDPRVADCGLRPLAAVVVLVAGLQYGIAAGGVVERLRANGLSRCGRCQGRRRQCDRRHRGLRRTGRQGPAVHGRKARGPTARGPEAHRPEAHRPEAHRPEAHRPEAHRPEAR